MNFNDLYWHDSLIQSISINRSNPGYDDSIIFEMDWYDRGPGKIIFYGVLKATLDLNFGVIALESVLDATCTVDDEDLKLLQKEPYSSSLAEDMTCYIINTNSTASQIKIYAMGFQLEN